MSNIDLGLVTAYGYAKSQGFTGTETEFATMLANVEDYKNQSQEYAKTAKANAELSEQYKNEAFDTTPAGYESLVSDVEALKEVNGGTIYGFHVDATNSNPTSAVTYLKDAIGLTAAYMNFTSDTFNWGSWKDAFFMPRPCMLKFDGTVDYYLNENDYTLKEDGTASDVADLSYEGNAMMEWGRYGKRIYYKIESDLDDNGYSVYIADYEVDSTYKCHSFINNQGNLVDHFYTPIYNGNIDDNGLLRSMSGILSANRTNLKTGAEELTAARLNNKGSDVLWNTEVFADVILINLLLILITKSLDSQGKIGLGNVFGGSETAYSLLDTGSMNDKGLFWGKNVSDAGSNHYGVKVFGMENWWGDIWRRFQGLMTDTNGKYFYKLTFGKEDGSDVEDYPTTAVTGMLEGGLLPSNLITKTGINNFITKMRIVNNEVMLPAVAESGSDSKYYEDRIYTNTAAIRYALRGGNSDFGLSAGAFALNVSRAFSLARWNFGACVSCKPLAR